MRHHVDVAPPPVLDPRLIARESPNLRLLLPWARDEAGRWDGRSWADATTGGANDERRMAFASAIELEVARPSAMIVMQQILDAWRSAERLLDSTFEGSPERRRLRAEIATLRELYQGLFEQVREELPESS